MEAFEQVFAKFGLDKVNTVGDAFVAVGGLAQPTPEAVKSCVFASFTLSAIANAFVPSFRLHMGIHIG